MLTLHGFYPGAKKELALRFVLARQDQCVVVSKEVLRLVQEKSWAARAGFRVINNGVDAKRLLVLGPGLRDELGMSAGQSLFGMIGNFQAVAQKDQLTVCRALPAVFQAIPDAHFVFVGARSESAPKLFDDCVDFCRQAGIAERVHFVGKRTDIGAVLLSLDLLVLSTLREGSPISVIEAMMAGVPVLLSDIAPLRDISGEGKYGIVQDR